MPYIEVYSSSSLSLSLSLTVTLEKTSRVHVSWTVSTTRSKLSLSGISPSMNSHPFSGEIQETPILDSTANRSPERPITRLDFGGAKLKRAPTRLRPNTAFFSPKDSSVSPVPSKAVAACSVENFPRKIFQSIPSTDQQQRLV